MPVQTLAVLFASSIAITGALLADRERYIHEFRAFDLNFRSSMLLSKASKDTLISRAHKEVAKTWLRRSVDFRRQSIYITFSAVHMIFCSVFLLLTFLVDFFFNNMYFWPLLVIAIGFLFCSFSNYLIRYGVLGQSKYSYIKSFFSYIEDVSHKLADIFPPLMPPLVLSHLSFSSWAEISEIMENDDELIDLIRRIAEYSDLKRHKLVNFWKLNWSAYKHTSHTIIIAKKLQL